MTELCADALSRVIASLEKVLCCVLPLHARVTCRQEGPGGGWDTNGHYLEGQGISKERCGLQK